MKYQHWSLTTVLVLLSVSHVAGQSTDGQSTVEELKSPPSPAFVLLGVSPSRVERPQTLRPLVVSALSAVASEGVPKNFSTEFAPYWLGTPRLSFDDYYDEDPRRDVVRHLTISVATTPLSAAPDGGSAIGLGLRTIPVPGHPHPRLKSRRADLKNAADALSAEDGFLESRPRLIALLRAALKASSAVVDARLEEEASALQPFVERAIALDIEVRKLRIKLNEGGGAPVQAKLDEKAREQSRLARDLLEAIAPVNSDESAARVNSERIQQVLTRLEAERTMRVTKFEAARRNAALAIQDLDTQRVGPLLAVASAIAWDVPGNDTSRSTVSKLGLWVTPGYRMLRCPMDAQSACSTAVDFLAVIRYLSDRRAAAPADTWELGGRVVWQAQRPLAVSAEWLERVGSDEDAGQRLVGVAEYQLSDAAYLYASFGRDFAEKDTRRNLVSVVGLTFGFGKKPILAN